MIGLSLSEALDKACGLVAITAPARVPAPGQWVRTDAIGKNGKNDGAVLIFDDLAGGLVWNHQTAQHHRFVIGGEGRVTRDPEAERRARERDRAREVERRIVERVCADIVASCRQEPHPYLARKGFPKEIGLVCDDPRLRFPAGRFGELLARALPDGDGPLLIIPGRTRNDQLGGKLTTVQFITPDGIKKNILRGVMGGASHRIATGRETWVCEGIGTALSVRAALRFLGRSATVLTAFSASNVGQVAEAIPGAIIAADHDKPVETLDGLGAGEFYARRSGRKWTMPVAPGDFNDWQERDGLRAVAIHLREVTG